MGFAYGILGAGRQGTAAAYDLILRGHAARVTLADVDEGRARAAAARVNDLTGSGLAQAVRVDAASPTGVRAFLEPLDAFVGSASYRLNLALSESAIEARTHMCDLGGNTSIVRAQLDLDDRARGAGVCIVPDCGEAPGLATNLMVYALDLVDEPQDLRLLDGGLPAEPVPPWNYELTFNVDGLTNEYDGTTTWLEDGRLVEVDCLDPAHYELVEFEAPYGTLEAFPAATGSTAPWSLRDRLRSLRAKVIRYPGHFAQFRAFRDLGLFSEAPVDVGGVPMSPRDLFHALLEPRVRAGPSAKDVVIARVEVTGRHGGRPARAVVDLRVHPDERFTAMERSTGWHAAIVCHMMAAGRVAPGARPVEVAVDAAAMVGELRDRGLDVRTRVG